jgi:hypothetical protein
MASETMAGILESSATTTIHEQGFILEQQGLMVVPITEIPVHLRVTFRRISSHYYSLKQYLSPKLPHPCSVGLCLFSFLFPLTGCLSRSLTSLQIVPAAGVSTVAVGQTSQFKVQAMYAESGHATTTADVTSQVTWQSSSSAVATISAAGLATGISAGTSNISASIDGGFGTVIGTSDILVTTAPSPRILISLAVIPSSQIITATNETAQFIAIGTYSAAPLTQDLTVQVSWQSSDVKVANIDVSGLVTGIGVGQATITALATASNGSVISASEAFQNEAASGPVNMPTLTVYEVGSGTGTVTGNGVINCSPQSPSTGCIGNFPVATVVTLYATPNAGSKFDGWSANCVPAVPNSTNSCTVTMSNNDTVGAIFDPINP